MAGTPSLVIETDGTNHSFPDVFQYISIACRTDGSGNVSANQLIHYCDQNTVVDAAYIRMSLGDDDATWTLEKCTDGTAVGSGVDMSNAITYTKSGGGALTNKTQTWTLVADQNIVDAGSAISLKVTGTSTATTVLVTLRIRTRIG